jgi:DNA-binding response OmpR family regulator
MRLLLLENRSAFAERLAAALSEGGLAHCDCDSLSAYERRCGSDSTTPYDAIVLDLRRDAKNSLKICRRIVRRTSHLPVIAVTAVDCHDEAVRMVQAGVEDVCLRDEFDSETLRNRIRCAIERYRVSRIMAAEVEVAVPAMSGAVDADQSELPCALPLTDFGESQYDNQALQLACLISPGLEASSANEPAWTASLGTPVEIAYCDLLDELVEHVSTHPTDAVVLYMNDVDAAVLDAIATIKVHRDEAVIVLAAPDLDSEQAVKVIQHGADDLIASTKVPHETVARYLRQGLARRRRHAGAAELADEHSSEPRFQQRQTHFQQRSPRYYVTKSAIAIPIRPDLTPDRSVRAEGFTVDVSESGIGFDVGGLDELPSELLLAGVEGDDGVLYFATVEIRNWSLQQGRLHVGAQFVSPDRDLLRHENLTPTFRQDTGEFAPGLPQEALLEWVDLGIFRPVLVDRIYVCPKCGGMPTFRSGCRSCGSIHVASHQLLHHFDCSYLGRISQFASDGTVTCPKCGVKGALGSEDFELLEGPCNCLECNWSDSNTEVVGQCTRCSWHFPQKSASEQELIGYHVNRLEPQSLLGIS